MSTGNKTLMRASHKKGFGVAKIKTSIRSLSRMLSNPKCPLDAEARARKEAEIAQLQSQLASTEQLNKDKVIDVKYKMVRFFETKKITRRLAQVKRSLASMLISLSAPPTREELLLRHEAADLEERLLYITHYPSGEKYQSILRPLEDPEGDAARMRRLASVLEAQRYVRPTARMNGVGELAGFEYERRWNYGVGSGVGEGGGSDDDDGDEEEDDDKGSMKKQGQVKRVAAPVAAVTTTAPAAGEDKKDKKEKKDKKDKKAAKAAAAAAEAEAEGEEEEEEAAPLAKRARAAPEDEEAAAKAAKKDKKDKRDKKEKKADKAEKKAAPKAEWRPEEHRDADDGADGDAGRGRWSREDQFDPFLDEVSD